MVSPALRRSDVISYHGIKYQWYIRSTGVQGENVKPLVPVTDRYKDNAVLYITTVERFGLTNFVCLLVK